MTSGISVAIIGAGPSGFYTASALLKAEVACRIDIIEALPTPFGLVRAGVAPDHQSTKRVTRAFGQTVADPAVDFFGNVALARDVTLDELRALYDAVVLAVGAPLDRELEVPGGDKPGALGAAAFVGWYNGHPDFRDLDPALNTPAACVIGNGNVAIDVARVLVKTEAEMRGSDMPDYAARAIHAAPIRDVYIIGRRGPHHAKFTNKELSEMGELEGAVPLVDAAQLPEEIGDGMSDRASRLAQRNVETFRAFARRGADEKPKRVHFLFYAQPASVIGAERVEGLRLERTEVRAGRARGTGDMFDVPCGLIVSAIGYRMPALEGVAVDPNTGVVRNTEGRVAPGVYVVGWAKRGPTGVIGTNKLDGDRVAAQIREDLGAGGKPGREGLLSLLRERRVRWVSYADWQRIEAAETAAAPPGAPRRKLTRIKDMLAVLAGEVVDGGSR